MPKVRRVTSKWFCSKFHTLSSKNFENWLRFDEVTESLNLKVGTFLRHSVVVGGLIFYYGFFFLSFYFFFFRQLLSAFAERNSTKTGHMIGKWMQFEHVCPKSGVSPPPTNRRSKNHLFRWLRNLTATLTAYIFGIKHNIDIILYVSAVWTQLETRQDSFVLFRPSFDEFFSRLISGCEQAIRHTQFPIFKSSVIINIFEIEQLQIGNWVRTRQNSSKLGQHKTKLSCLVCSCVDIANTDKTSQSCLVRVGDVNKL